MSDTDEEKLVRHMPYEGHVLLAMLLTPDAINGNNYKLLAAKLGFTAEEIKNLETKREPVMELLQDRRCLDLTIAKLKSKLSEMERKDAITDLETFEGEKNCFLISIKCDFLRCDFEFIRYVRFNKLNY